MIKTVPGVTSLLVALGYTTAELVTTEEESVMKTSFSKKTLINPITVGRHTNSYICKQRVPRLVADKSVLSRSKLFK